MELEVSNAKDSHKIHERVVPVEDCSVDAREPPSRFSRLFRVKLNVLLSIFFLLVFLGATLHGVLQEDISLGSELFALLLLGSSAYSCGQVVTYVRLPPLIGMLIVGFLFRNLPFITYYENISDRWATTLRSSAFVIILLKAGLGLDAEQLKKLSRIVFQLAFCPCIVETIAAAIASHFLLGLPWEWAIMLGFVISAVSPAVIVPGLLNLQNRQIGTDKGIPTLVIAAASVDDIIAITGFSVMLSVTFSEGSFVVTILKGILEPIGGLVFGIVFGRIFWNLPGPQTPYHMVYYRVTLLCCAGFSAMFLSKQYDVAGVGPMACLVLAFVATLGWKKKPLHFGKIVNITEFLWIILQPFLFGLIGAEVSVADLQFNLGSTMAVFFIALFFRIIAATFATFGSDLNLKEKIFIAFAWLPKATVQAAVGPQALDYVLSNKKGGEMEKNAQMILTAAVVSIIITAPIGAALIALLGPTLLSHDGNKQEPENRILKTTDTEVL